MRQSALALEGPPEKRFRGRDIPLGAEQEIDSLSFFVDGAVKISPAPLDLHVGFIDSPGGAVSAREAVPAPFEVRNIALDPAHYRRMGQRNPAFDHHFHEIAKAELEPEIPPDAEDDDLSVEMRPLKRSSMFSIRVRTLQKSVHAKYAVLLPFAPEPIGRIDEDRSIEGCEGLYQCFRESAPWIVAAVCEEFPIMRHAIAIDCVQ